MAKNGIPLGEGYIKLPSSISSVYKNWTKNNNHMFSTLNRHICQIITTLDPNATIPITQEDIKNCTYNAPAHLIHEKVMHAIHETNKDTIFTKTPLKD